ncbi:MAG: hypothetical protein PHT91_01700 [Candidatus Nanoarchaeia archaeon]|nr:hypothetical protein [Candidatus Nanoarchaeia archaeon]MDD5054210.1 hypothetical protein [Candidatus Nanoarchaeia archaeon]MDD5499570.1 hypothetical protein [Candidatus Nanoarchaeia archaeon]
MIKESRMKAIKKSLKNYPRFEFLGKGKRGEVYRISESLAVKIEKDDIQAKNTAKNEHEILKKLQPSKYFPKTLLFNEKLRFLIREYVKGNPISKTKDKRAFLGALNLARELDLKGINQQEMNNPYKHIFILKNKPKMIDFEKARISKKPKNVTQFCQYFCKKYKISPKKIMKASIAYKKTYSEKDFKALIKILKELTQ